MIEKEPQFNLESPEANEALTSEAQLMLEKIETVEDYKNFTKWTETKFALPR